MKKFVIQSVLLLLVIGIALVFFGPNSTQKTIDLPFLPPVAKYTEVLINGKTLKVELADTSSKRSKGLSGRTSLGELEGMLFVFPKADKHPFWMKGMKIPLDFVWIIQDRVVDILENVLPPSLGQADSSLKIYSASIEIDKVLELPAGTVKKLDIKVGDLVKIQ